MNHFQTWAAGLLCIASTLLPNPGAAETIKIIVPFAAGGPVDQLARVLANKLGPKLDADVIVEDRGGAGGALGVELVARAAPDGKTILLGSLGSQVLGPILKPPVAYDPINGLVPIILVGSVSSLLVSGPKLDVLDLTDLIAQAKRGRAMTYGSAGPGSTMNIAGEMLNASAGLRITHVPYRGAAPAISDLLGGHLDMLSADVSILLPLVRSHSVKALALLATDRSPLLPEVPTTTELQLPAVVMENWYGVFVPSATPPDVQQRLETALSAVLDAPSVHERLASDGIRGALGADAFRARLAKEFTFWRHTISALGISAE